MTEPEDEVADFSAVLAGVHFDKDEEIDPILHRVAARLLSQGVSIRGLLARVAPDPQSPNPIMYVESIADGAMIQISQRLGPEASGCRLDPAGLAAAASVLEVSLQSGTALLILNRFGRVEAEGGGLRSVIERALASDIPVLIAVRDTYEAAWRDFHGGTAAQLPSDEETITRWSLKAAMQPSRITEGA